MTEERPVSQPERDDRFWATLCHIAGLAIFILPPFGGVLGPLIVWLLKKDQSSLVNDQGKESVNFQISVLIYAVISSVLIVVVIGLVLLPALLLFDIIQVVIAAMKANEGVAYRYPLTIRFIS